MCGPCLPLPVNLLLLIDLFQADDLPTCQALSSKTLTSCSFCPESVPLAFCLVSFYSSSMFLFNCYYSERPSLINLIKLAIITFFPLLCFIFFKSPIIILDYLIYLCIYVLNIFLFQIKCKLHESKSVCFIYFWVPSA